MSNKELSLFILEGANTENKLIEKLEQNFLGERFAIKCIFDAEIYQLYRTMKEDEGFSLDVANLLKERNPENAEKLKEYTRDSFAYTYLFFDYDAHATLADDEKIIEMLSFFNNETENGMLYISYPMVEAIRHFKDMDSFRYLTVKCKGRNCSYMESCPDKEKCLKEPHYKTFVPTDNRPQLSNVNAYTREVWQELITAHLSKMNDLVNDVFELPKSLQSQVVIFNKQLEKHINHQCPKVAVLSAFPLFVLDYFGCEKLKSKLESE